MLAKLPKIDDLQAQLAARNAELLRVIELVIEAAKIEDLDDELRDQTILAFKTDTTTARWDQIRRVSFGCFEFFFVSFSWHVFLATIIFFYLCPNFLVIFPFWVSFTCTWWRGSFFGLFLTILDCVRRGVAQDQGGVGSLRHPTRHQHR